MASQQDKIAVFPAAGKLGTSVYTHLSKLVSPSQLILISRSPEKISQDLVASGIETRKADYDSPETLKHAFDGVSHLFLISYPTIENDHRFEVHKAAIIAALNSNPNLKHLFYTSLGFAGNGSKSAAAVMQAHLRTEAWLQTFASEKNFKYTVIREGIYSETFPMYTAFWSPPEAEIVMPHDGSGPGVAWVAINDLGEASARLVQTVLDGSARYNNKTIVLSGSKEYTLAQTVALLGDVSGKEIKLTQGSEEQYVANSKVMENLGSHGHDDVPSRWATVYEAIRNGETSVVNGELELLLGRPAESFEDTVRRVLEAPN